MSLSTMSQTDQQLSEEDMADTMKIQQVGRLFFHILTLYIWDETNIKVSRLY